MNPVSVCLCDSSRERAWNDYVDRSERTVFAHHLGWKTVVERTFGHRSYYLVAYRDDEVVGMLPLVLVESFLFGRFLTTSPFLTYGGIACDDDEVATALVAEAETIAQDCRVDYVEFRNDRQFRHLPYRKTSFCSLVLDLSQGPDEI